MTSAFALQVGQRGRFGFARGFGLGDGRAPSRPGAEPETVRERDGVAVRRGVATERRGGGATGLAAGARYGFDRTPRAAPALMPPGRWCMPVLGSTGST